MYTLKPYLIEEDASCTPAPGIMYSMTTYHLPTPPSSSTSSPVKKRFSSGADRVLTTATNKIIQEQGKQQAQTSSNGKLSSPPTKPKPIDPNLENRQKSVISELEKLKAKLGKMLKTDLPKPNIPEPDYEGHGDSHSSTAGENSIILTAEPSSAESYFILVLLEAIYMKNLNTLIRMHGHSSALEDLAPKFKHQLFNRDVANPECTITVIWKRGAKLQNTATGESNPSKIYQQLGQVAELSSNVLQKMDDFLSDPQKSLMGFNEELEKKRLPNVSNEESVLLAMAALNGRWSGRVQVLPTLVQNWINHVLNTSQTSIRVLN